MPDDTVLRGLPEEFFSAYAVFRIRHQLQFVDWKLRHGQPVFSDFSPQSLETILANGSLIATLALVVTEIFIALALLPSVSPSWAHGFSPWAHWIAICFAVVALGMRTLEEGLQPKRELERYERYGALIQDILDRFEAGSRSVRFEAMVEMERLSFEEMRDFLRSAYEARFVM